MSMFYNLIRDFLWGEMSHEQLVITVRVTFLILIFHIAWSASVLPGFPGFALASKVDRVEKWALEKDILSSQDGACKALFENNKAALKYSVDNRRNYLSEWKKMVGDEFYLPTCEELGYRRIDEDIAGS